jgi:hypothetical protein
MTLVVKQHILTFCWLDAISTEPTASIPANCTTARDTGPQAIPSRSAVLDTTHVGDIVGAFGPIRRDATGTGHSWWQRIRMCFHYRTRIDRDDRRQRCRWCRYLHAGRTELRHESAVDASADDLSAVRESGNQQSMSS